MISKKLRFLCLELHKITEIFLKKGKRVVLGEELIKILDALRDQWHMG